MGHARPCGCRDLPGVARNTGSPTKSGGRPALDSLESVVGRSASADRESLLHGLPIHARSGRRAAIDHSQAAVAEGIAFEVAADNPAGPLLLDLRGLQLVEQSIGYGLDYCWLFRGFAGGGQPVPRSELL